MCVCLDLSILQTLNFRRDINPLIYMQIFAHRIERVQIKHKPPVADFDESFRENKTI